MISISMDEAIEVFVRGFAFTRTFTFPYLAEQVHEGVWALRDALRARGNYRTEEYVAHGVDAVTLDAVARRNTRGRYRICTIRAVDESDERMRSEFKSLGYRLMTTEALMVHGLQQIESVDAPMDIKRVTTIEEGEALAKTARSRQILPEYIQAEQTPMRQYVAMDNREIVGWVGSVVTCGCAWCTNMFVMPGYRRRGIAKALMTKMLQDDRSAGAKANVLLASHAGAMLYPTVGYEQRGELLAYVPKPNQSPRS